MNKFTVARQANQSYFGRLKWLQRAFEVTRIATHGHQLLTANACIVAAHLLDMSMMELTVNVRESTLVTCAEFKFSNGDRVATLSVFPANHDVQLKLALISNKEEVIRKHVASELSDTYKLIPVIFWFFYRYDNRVDLDWAYWDHMQKHGFV